MLWLIPVALLGGAGLAVALSGSKAKAALRKLVTIRTLGVEEGGGLVFSFDELVAVRNAGYQRANELKFTRASKSIDVLAALFIDRDARLEHNATLRWVTIGTLGDMSASDIEHQASQFLRTWGDLQDHIDGFLRERGLL